jgi:hypothetical protein
MDHNSSIVSVIKEPEAKVYCLSRAPQALGFITRVLHVDSSPPDRDCEYTVMLLAQWDPEPCEVIASSDVVQFHILGASALCASQGLLERSARKLLGRCAQTTPPDRER